MDDIINLEIKKLFGLFIATVEQSNFINGQLKQKPKMDFKVWQKQGFKLMDEILDIKEISVDEIRELADYYHNAGNMVNKVLKEKQESKK